ncbi:hypothetical protein LINPERPRIM_LOCUS24678 [Linum perenne]
MTANEELLASTSSRSVIIPTKLLDVSSLLRISFA